MNFIARKMGARYNPGTKAILKNEAPLNRDTILSATHERFETGILALIKELNSTLLGLSKVPYLNISDQRAVGSVLNSALPDAADSANLAKHGLYVMYTYNGQSNKITGKLPLDGVERHVSIELHLSGPRGGTSKALHQFACKDSEEEPYITGLEPAAPQDLLFFIALHLNGTGSSIAWAHIKFADGVDTKMIRIECPPTDHAGEPIMDASMNTPTGTKFTPKKTKKEGKVHGGTTDKRRNAAPGSE